MVSIHLWIAFLLLGSVFGASAPTLDQIIWQDADCPKITTKDECLKVGFCYWLGLTNGNCKRDPCVGLPNGTDCQATEMQCTNYYLDDKIDCTTNIPAQEKQFCQAVPKTDEMVTDITEGNFDSCLYSSIVGYLENRVDCNPVLCKWEKHKATDKYLCVSSGNSDCSKYVEDPQAFCGCLNQHKNEDYCGLSPYCIYTSGQCVFDECTKYKTVCPTEQKCKMSSVNPLNGNGGDTTKIAGLCVADSRSDGSDNMKYNKPNPCYFAIDNTQDCGSKDGCETSITYDSPSAKCSLKPIAEGVFPTSSYCTDGRFVPSPGSSSVFRIPYLLVALILVVFVL